MTVREVEERSQWIGPYRILRRLGQGGMGIVYLAQDAQFHLVALKVLRPELADDEGFRRRFDREAQAARQVARFCTAPVVDAGIDGDVAYLVTEYVDGPDLSSVVATQGPMSGANLEALAVGVAAALAAIHQAGVVHRDLKPSNILLSAVGPRVIDFGIARLDEPHATQSAVVVGTPAYMAPEQADGGPATAAGDVFAWGGVIAYAGTGQPPFGTGQVAEVLYRVAHHAPRLDGLDERLRPWVERALQKDPGGRPTAQQLLDGLLGREQATVSAATRAVSAAWTPPAPLQTPPPPAARRRWPLALLAAALSAALASGVTAVIQRSGEPHVVAAPRVTVTAVTTTTATRTVTATPAPVATNTIGAGTVLVPGKEEAGRPFRQAHGPKQLPGFVQIDSLARQGHNVKLQFTVRNDAASESMDLSDLFGGNTTDLSAIELTLVGEPAPFRPMWEQNTCVCSGWGLFDGLGAGDSKRFYAVFRRVPDSATTVDLDLLRLGLFKNVRIAKK
ncbi:serine/threonine-protein kinase [Nonomuraea wenchangensis]